MAKKNNLVVDSKWLKDLAKLIHDGHSGKYLRLCTGTLQNGPDPVDGKRTMHCGLGELYFQMTGRQPEQDSVTESDVIEECINRTVLAEPDQDELEEKLTKSVTKAVTAAVKDLKLEKHTISDMVSLAVDEKVQLAVEEAEEKARKFRETLEQIPDINDNTGAGTESLDEDGKMACSMGDFKERSKAVAAVLREAAALLPE